MGSTYNFDDYFEHKSVDKIYGEPDAKSLRNLFKQIKRNARSITSNLGGGQYGHLFMVIHQDDWNNLPNTIQVEPPQDPGAFNIQGRLTATEIAVQQKEHEEAKRKYERYQALQRVLRNQLVSAIEPCYLDPIRCPITDMVNQPIIDIMQFLRESYGKMTVNQIDEEITNIKNFEYDPTKSINTLITAIQEHADLLQIAGAELKDKQIQDLAYLILNKFQIFKDALVAWNKIAPPKTWEQMKNHLRNEYQMLKSVNALSISESILNATEIVHQLKTQQENLLESAEKRFKHGLTEVMNLTIHDIEKEKTQNESSEQINSVAEIMALKQEIKKLQSQLRNKATGGFNQSGFNNYGMANSTKNFQWQNRTPKINNKFNKQYYCWTHGAGHSGWRCMNPAEGHQPEATFSNRMGGNNYGCYSSRPNRFNNNNNTRPRFNNNNNQEQNTSRNQSTQN